MQKITFFLQICGDDSVGFTLGTECNGDWECREHIVGSICHKGRCSCQPFYARVNQSSCLPSTLLGYECQVPEQCSLKVANSSCLDGVCRCIDGFLQFRKHTCLGPARPGNVCYSNAHCRLWTADSHCDFLIPNLFGRCQCNAPFKQMGDSCGRTAFQSQPTTAAPPKTESTTLQPNIETNAIVTPQVKSSAKRTNSTKKGFHPRKGGVRKTTTIRPTTSVSLKTTTLTTTMSTTTTTELPEITKVSSTPGPVDYSTRANVASRTTTMEPSSTASPVPQSQTTSTSTTASPASPFTTAGIRKRFETSSEAISLGLPCVTDLQCRAADPSSKCIEGVCDCIMQGNETTACSARNTGCIPGTFQCRSSGTCISWFFVCDGRKDCSDGSDEDCRPNKCPNESFRCRDTGKCISKANRCDGVRDCHLGEDEANCHVLGKNKCPPDTFQCGDGKCLPEYEFCNAIIGCSDGSDEPAHICRGRARRRLRGYCPLRCGNGRCRSTAIACSGRDGCGDGTDESHCSVCRCPIIQGRSSLS
ncbi:uncharacterized protein LOC125505073 [Dendroctonus ponderosae]|uniref:uncharacterized protein LOC125505073 n=1 Tax=Dendroctonus ponderosae TaxID=77166 RepID=UPI0020355334|nr:uncharacterized protein LOC125505073 [Dendroctonus ponderosae]